MVETNQVRQKVPSSWGKSFQQWKGPNSYLSWSNICIYTSDINLSKAHDMITVKTSKTSWALIILPVCWHCHKIKLNNY